MVDCHPAVLTVMEFFRPQCEQDMIAMFLDTLWSSTITPKGLWELFIQWVVPAIKFDWLTYIPAVMFIPLASSPLQSPSKKVGYLGAGWEVGWGRRYSGNRHLQNKFTLKYY